MLPYIFIYILSTFLIYISELIHVKDIITQILKAILVLLGVSVLGLFVAFSSDLVGTDRLGYVVPIFSSAVQFQSFKSLSASYPSVEFGYLFFNWIVAKITPNIMVFYYTYTVIISGLFYLSFNLVRKKINFIISWMLYLTMFFPAIMSLFRQSIAVSLVTFASILLYKEEKIFAPILLITVASTVHSSGVIGYIFFVIIYFLKKKDFSIKYQIIIFLITGFFTTVITPLLTLFINIGILSSKYTNYATGYLGIDENTGIGISVIFILLAIFFTEDFKSSSFFRFVLFFSIISFFIIPLNNISAVIGRLGFYFKIFQILYYSAIMRIIYFEKEIYLKRLVIGVIILTYVILSSNNYVLGLYNQQGSGTFGLYPYILK